MWATPVGKGIYAILCSFHTMLETLGFLHTENLQMKFVCDLPSSPLVNGRWGTKTQVLSLPVRQSLSSQWVRPFCCLTLWDSWLASKVTIQRKANGSPGA